MRKPNQVDLVVDMREGGDWSLDLLFAGLVHNLGPEGVAMSPFRWKHTEWEDPRTPRDWGLERRTLGYTGLNRFIHSEPDHAGYIRMLARIGRLRRIWVDERMESFNYLRTQLGPLVEHIPVVVVAGHDRFWNNSPQFVAGLYGKRLEAMLLDNWYDSYASLPFKVRRIGWSTNFDHYWRRPEVPPQKDIDISFVGYNSHPDRARFIDHIERRWSHLKNHIMLERQPDTLGQFVSKATYFDLMQRSRICLNLRGAADRGKTMRAYEIPYVGSCMLSQRIDDPGMTEDFVDGFHCMYFDDEVGLDACIEHLLDEPERREQIAHRGHVRATTDLSVTSRWREVLGWLGDV
jgi:hypothetical protein